MANGLGSRKVWSDPEKNVQNVWLRASKMAIGVVE
jgi:hypothetical protein